MTAARRESPFIAEARRRRRARFLSDALLTNAEPWTGAVERLSELGPARRAALGLPAVERRRSVVMIVRCAQRWCGHWTPRRFTHCVICHQRHDGA